MACSHSTCTMLLLTFYRRTTSPWQRWKKRYGKGDSNDGILSGESGSVPSWFYRKTGCYKLYLRIYTDKTDIRELCRQSGSRRNECLRHDFLVITTRPDDLVWEDWSRHPATIPHPRSGSNLPKQVFHSVVTSLSRLPIDVWWVLWGTGSVKIRQLSWSSSCASLHPNWHAFAVFLILVWGINFDLCIEYELFETDKNEWNFTFTCRFTIECVNIIKLFLWL